MKTYLKALLAGWLIVASSFSFAQEAAPINVNTADAELLAELPGIGAAKAQAIIEDREANGEFTSAEDLTRVSGIGPATVERFRDQIEF